MPPQDLFGYTLTLPNEAEEICFSHIGLLQFQSYWFDGLSRRRTPIQRSNADHSDEPTVGFYALNGESVVNFPETQEKEQICGCPERIREQNPGKRILIVLDNFSSYICPYTRRRAHQLGIDLVFLPVGSPDLNPIEPVWKSLRWEASPLIVESAEEFHALVTDLF